MSGSRQLISSAAIHARGSWLWRDYSTRAKLFELPISTSSVSEVSWHDFDPKMGERMWGWIPKRCISSVEA